MGSITSASSKMRLTGMATGIDTDAAIKQMMTAYYARVNKSKQQQQILQWKQESYRDFVGQINSLKSKYFDVLSKDYILSSNNFSAFKITPADALNNSIIAKATTGAVEGNYKIEVTSDKIATKASLNPAKSVNVKEATAGVSFPIVIKHIDDTNQNDRLSVTDKNGTRHNVTIKSGTYNNLNDLAAQINKDMASVDIGSDKKLSDDVKAVVKDGKIKFLEKITIDEDNKDLVIDVGETPQNITIESGSYTMEELASKITSKLSDGYKATTSEDGLTISLSKDGFGVSGTAYFKDEDDDISNNEKVSVGSVSLQRSDTAVDTDDFSNPIISDTETNELSFDKRIIAGVNDTLTFTVFNGGTEAVSRSIKLTAKEYDIDGLIGEINNRLQQAKYDYDNDGTQEADPLLNTISLSKSADGKILFNSTTSNQITISGNAATTLGVSSAFKMDQSSSDKMANIVKATGANSKVSFTINGKTYNYDFESSSDEETYIGAKNKTISDILNDISKGSNVDISYSQLDRKFYMTSKNTGSNENITITDDSGFVKNLFGTKENGTLNLNDGTDVVVKITQPNGSSNTIIQSSNDFTVDGVSYTLNSKPTEAITFEVKGSTEDTFNKIKGFIDSYNELIGKISSAVEEKKQYSFLPLTDEEKESMSEDQIEKWETKAKQGMLSGDSTLGNMLIQMRKAFFDKVEGAGTSLFEIGLNTSSDVSQRGKIVIDEKKLTEALKNDADKVMNLFIQKSTSKSSYSRSMKSDDRRIRYNEEGIFNRISDIIEDNISTFRDSNGKKGTLLEIAGVKGDFTEFQNMITSQIQDKESKINEMLDRIYEKEERYYKQFAQLETAMNNMNAQTSWLYSQLGMSQG